MDKCSRIHNPFWSSLARTMFFRILLLASAIFIVSLLYSLPTMVDFGSIIAPKTSSLYYDDLSKDCKSLNFANPLMNLMESLMEERPYDYENKITYLPEFKDLSSTKKNFVYVNIGGGNNWFPESYPIDKEYFDVYFVHHDVSFMTSSHVTGARGTFVYCPELNEKYEELQDNVADEYMEEEEFDLVSWFEELVKNADFVVLQLNAGEVEMKFLWDIYESGVICFVDELFLSCSKSEYDESCMDIYTDLRSNGVFVHQWWNSELHQVNEGM